MPHRSTTSRSSSNAAGQFEKPAAREWKAPRPTVVWSVDTGAPVWAGLERAEDGMLFVGNEKGDVHAIDRDGKVRWKFATEQTDPRATEGDWRSTSTSPPIRVTSTSCDRDTGAEAWRARIDSGSEPRTAHQSGKNSLGSLRLQRRCRWQRLYIASRDKNLYALDMKSGRELWRVAAVDIMTATPALHGDLVIFAAYDGKVQRGFGEGWRSALDLRREARRCRRCGGGRRSRAGRQPQLRSDRARCGHAARNCGSTTTGSRGSNRRRWCVTA